MNKPEPVQTCSEIQAALASIGMRPRHRFGQNFLIDGNLMRRLAESGEIDPQDVVLEVGPGTGGLTDLLLRRAGHVISVEIDHQLQQYLATRYDSDSNFTLISADILETKNRLNPSVIDTMQSISGNYTGSMKLVANLPYDVATPMLMNLVQSPLPIERYCFTVQKEVGERIMAKPGGKNYGPLSIILQMTCNIDLVAILPPDAFWPRPKIESSMIRMIRTEGPPLIEKSLESFVDFVRTQFLHRRKTLRHNLKAAHPGCNLDRFADIVDLSRRPETLTPQQWVDLFASIIKVD